MYLFLAMCIIAAMLYTINAWQPSGLIAIVILIALLALVVNLQERKDKTYREEQRKKLKIRKKKSSR